MNTGRDNLQLINQHIQQARTEHQEAGLRLEELHRQLNALHMETVERYRQLARLRLDNIQAGQLVSRMDESDRAIINLLEKIKQARQDLQEQIKAATSRQQQFEERRKELERRRDQAIEAMQRQVEETRRRATETDAYRQQRERDQEAAAVARQADEKASRTERDQVEKGKPYEADSLFMYLWKRRYLTPDYQAGRLIRQLDGWVANLIDFRRNRLNYHMLQELPRRLRDHAVKARQTAQLEAQALQAMERQAAEADGIPALQSEVRDVEKQLKQHDSEMEAEVTRNRQLFRDLAAINTATDPLSQQVIELQVAALQRRELTELLREARNTPRPEDDVLVGQLQQIQQQQNQIATEIQSVGNFLQQRQKNMAELEELRRRYHENGYDAYNSSFPGNFSLAVLLGQLLGGLMNSDMVWRELGRHHHGGPHRGGWGGGFRGGWGESRGGSEGRGDEGSGFGGGEFRTRGGF